MRYLQANIGIDAYDKQEIDDKLTLLKLASGTIASFNTDLASALKECEVSFTAYQASGTPTPSSPIPISGYSSAELIDCGINIWDEEWEVGGISNTTGENTSSNSYYRSKNYIPIKPNANYYFKHKTTDTIGLRFYKSDKSFLGSYALTGDVNNLLTYGNSNLPTGTAFLRFVNTTTNAYEDDVSINYPSTDTTYHAYSGTSVVIPFGDTYYGGEIDVVRGKLRATYYGVVYDGSESGWNFAANYQQAFIPLPYQAYYDANSVTYICDRLNPCPNSQRGPNTGNYSSLVLSGNSVAFSTPETSLDNFKTWLSNNNVTFVYKLATPIEINLTPEVLSTISGDNNVFCDIPTSSVEVEYLTSQAKDVVDVVELLTKPIEVSGTLTAGTTSITLSDERITTDSTIDVYTSDGTEWNDVTVTTGVVVITFDAQASDIGVKVRVS